MTKRKYFWNSTPVCFFSRIVLKCKVFKGLEGLPAYFKTVKGKRNALFISKFAQFHGFCNNKRKTKNKSKNFGK